MTDTLHRYSHSKHSRRQRSVGKQKDKLLLKKRLDSITSSPSHRAKTVLEHQRKEWTKLKKKSKPRAQRLATLLPQEDIEDNPWCDAVGSGSDDDHVFDTQSRAHSVDSYVRSKRIFYRKGDLSFTHNIHSVDSHLTPRMLRNSISSLMSHQFANYDLKYMQFDLSTFNGQCSYWYHVMDALGVVDEVYYGHYLNRCTTEMRWSSKLYREKMLDHFPPIHSLYVFGDIKCAADRQFDNDVANAHRVVMDRGDLVHILYRHNAADLTLDLCAMIGTKSVSLCWIPIAVPIYVQYLYLTQCR